MSKTVQDFWNYQDGMNAEKKHGIYRVTEFESLPLKTSGLYSWHIDLDHRSLNSYFKIFKQRRLQVTMQGNLGDKFGGKVPNMLANSDYDNSKGLDIGLCQYCSLAFCPPMYIGISKDLKARLNQHLTELEKVIGKKIKLQETPNLVGRTNLDTIYESSHFAQRMGFTMVQVGGLGLNKLFVKTIELDSTYSWADLQKVEKYLNRTYTPIYGRR